MNTLENQTIGEIVSEDYRTAGVFKKFGLDFCCGGGRTVSEACAKKGVDLDKLNQELAKLDQTPSAEHNYKDWSASFLIDYIINNHHQYVRAKLPEISAYAQKVAKVHGKGRPALVKVRDVFLELQPVLLEHLEKEEQILFPYIKQMVAAEQVGDTPEKPHFNTVKNPVSMMEEEHDEAGAAMAKIQELTDNFTLPQEACATYRVLFQNLEAFQDDLHKHVHLENNILFPKALELEKQLN